MRSRVRRRRAIGTPFEPTRFSQPPNWRLPMQIDFSGRHVVVTGGTGALGGAVVELLINAGAVCHVPSQRPADPKRFPLAAHERVNVVSGVDLTDEAAVAAFYQGLPGLWASVQAAGGFAMSPAGETSLDEFRRMIDTNAVTCCLCCREAVR